MARKDQQIDTINAKIETVNQELEQFRSLAGSPVFCDLSQAAQRSILHQAGKRLRKIDRIYRILSDVI